jgi:hypothetical protein
MSAREQIAELAPVDAIACETVLFQTQQGAQIAEEGRADDEWRGVGGR